jgi:hypothetical protein
VVPVGDAGSDAAVVDGSVDAVVGTSDVVGSGAGVVLSGAVLSGVVVSELVVSELAVSEGVALEAVLCEGADEVEVGAEADDVPDDEATVVDAALWVELGPADDSVGAANAACAVPASTGGRCDTACFTRRGSAATGTTIPAPLAYNRSRLMTSRT